MFKKLFSVFFLMPVIFYISCSSSPKRPMKITDTRNLAAANLENAVKFISREDYMNAGRELNQAYELALSIDSRELICKTALSTVIFELYADSSIIQSVNSADFAQITKLNEEELISFSKEAAEGTENQIFLNALSEIYSSVIVLSKNRKDDFSETLKKLNRVEETVKSDSYYSAFFYKTRGELELSMNDISGAEKDFEKAAELHLKNRWLSELGNDWFCISLAFSLNGKKGASLNAIKTALQYDKDAENSKAIISDYHAMAQILLKGSPSDAEKAEAQKASGWADLMEKSLNEN